ncbi:MAG: transketolase [Alphaproteobacteria bacterium]|nr:transketolase [Alphaproteobacteria bacterium]MDA8004453.1 transketolase [Alphaproteobacteria bacterium]MDA8005400.1 transketolase [Alphaproteobacteria bacterium]MDA8013738.1 transketolase [Alphaproteobacteria bacterium]
MTPPPSPAQLRRMAAAVRVLAADAVENAASGHPGMPLGMADVAAVLFTRFLKYDPRHPDWPDRDRFILSAGHGSMLLYALLHLCGYPKMTIAELGNFRRLGSLTPGHPEYAHTPGVETTTGPLGQGLANAVGVALAERVLAAEFGADLVSHRTYALAGDGCLMEGVGHEAASLAGRLRLGRLAVLWDDNRVTIDGPADLAFREDVAARFAALGWHTVAADGHDPAAVAAALKETLDDPRPSLVACRTTIAFGADKKAGTAASHGAPLGADEIAALRKSLDWNHPPFEIPEDIRQLWRDAAARAHDEHENWTRRLKDHPRGDEFRRRLKNRLLPEARTALEDLARKFAEDGTSVATRQASGQAIAALAGAMPELLGGSADLTGSNATRAESQKQVAPETGYAGEYIFFGVREHAMVAAMNGVALHGGFRVYGGTFLVFTDYARPAIRLAALMRLPVIFIMTHDSIGLGEDGPTHQPVEHLASLRAIPGLLVLRPCDAVETAEAWRVALEQRERPSLLALSRQSLPALRRETEDNKVAADNGVVADNEVAEDNGVAEGNEVAADNGVAEDNEVAAGNRVAEGGYVLREALGGFDARRVTLIATGSEVSLAVAAAEELEKGGAPTAVVSMPSWELFAEQSEEHRRAVLGDDNGIRVSVEAASSFGWSRFAANPKKFASVSLDGFGASARASDLFAHFGFTRDNVVRVVESLLADGN